MAQEKLTGKKKLQNDEAQQKVRVIQAQDALNATFNGKPLVPGSAAYIAADTKFQDEVKKLQAITLSISNYVEPVKPKSAKETEAQRQKDIKEGKVPPVGGTITTDPNTGQVKTVDDFKGLIKAAPKFLRDLSDDERLIIAIQLSDAGYEVPKIKAMNDALLGAYTSLINGAQAKNKQFPEDIKTVDDFLIEQTNINSQIKALGNGSELTKPFGQQDIFSRSGAESVIDSIFSSLNLGREATKPEIDTLFKQLQAEQKKLSSMSKGTYKMVGGRKVLVQEQGLDSRTFLENKIKELPAYKNSQAAKSEKSKISLASTALANGYNLETDFAGDLPNWLEAVNNGESLDKFKNIIRNNARRALPDAVRSQIAPDEDLSTTFSTYISNYATAFGIPASKVSLNKIIPMAITDKGFATLQQFEVKKRSSTGWDNSPEGFAITTDVINDTLKDFGMLGQGVRTV